MSERIGQRRKLTAIGVALLAIGLVNAPAPGAPSQSKTDSETLKFEVASIKPSRAEDRVPDSDSPSGMINWNSTVRPLILMAYRLQDYQLAGDPKWLNSEFYRIAAKPPAGPIPADQRTRMDETSERLRNLLVDRFQLTAHHETRNLQEYALVVAKGGAKLKEVKRGDEPFSMRIPAGKIITKGGATIEFLARILAVRLRCPVIDKTGLNPEQLYDIQLAYSPDDNPTDPAPTLFMALQEQLGLKLEAIKGPVDVLVIDHVERPSAN